MRHVLIAFLIALLPLRGWVGDAMAVSMLTAPDVAHTGCAEQVAPPTLVTAPQAAASHDMAMQDAATAQAQDNGAQTHSACDVCNGAVMGLPTPLGVPARQAHPRLAPHTVWFASSEPQPGHKPPIA